MRPAPRHALNLLASVLLLLLFAVAVIVTDRLGFFGLVLLGLLVWFVCLRAAQNDATPTWGVRTFQAQLNPASSPEERAARRAEQAAFVMPLRFYGRCGMALTAIGLAGIAAQHWLVLPG